MASEDSIVAMAGSIANRRGPFAVASRRRGPPLRGCRYCADHLEGELPPTESLRRGGREFIATPSPAGESEFVQAELELASDPFSVSPFFCFLVIEDVRERWNVSKQRFTAERLAIALKWMRDNDLVPTGIGPRTMPANGTPQ
jgi:hypothetical protein